MNGGCCIHSFRLSRIRIIWNDRAMIRSIKSCDFNFILLLSLQSREYRGDIEENYSTANFGCCNYLKKKNLWTEFFFRKSVNKIDKIIKAVEEGGRGIYITKRMFTFSLILSSCSYSNLDIEMLSVILICFVYLWLPFAFHNLNKSGEFMKIYESGRRP